MPVVFVIPGALREVAGNRDEIRIARVPATIGDALALLWAECPALRDRIVTERGEIRPHINIFVDGENIHDSGGMQAPVRAGSEVLLLPAISGGS